MEGGPPRWLEPGLSWEGLGCAGWFETWATGISSNPPQFEDSIALADANTRRLIIGQLRDEVERFVKIVNREFDKAQKQTRPSAPSDGLTAEQRRIAKIAQLKYTYDPPGELRPAEGPRHDNDFADIFNVRVAPTHQELLCASPPYLPVFLPEAPHHLPANSMERHLDIQFRLLREELM